jgi:hypothetical protein
MKRELESARSEVLGEFQMVSTKRQHAQARVTRAENKRLAPEVQVHRMLDVRRPQNTSIDDKRAAQVRN